MKKTKIIISTPKVQDAGKKLVDKMKISDLKEKEEYKYYIKRPTPEEYNDIKQDIIENGIIYPIVINQDNVIIDGYTRVEIAKELGYTTIKVDMRTFKDEEEEKRFIISGNDKRRHLNKAWQAYIAVTKTLKVEREKAKYRMKHPMEKFPEAEKGTAREKAGKLHHLSPYYVKQTEEILNFIDEYEDEDGKKVKKLWEKELDGNGNINKVHILMKTLEAHGKHPDPTPRIENTDVKSVSFFKIFKEVGKFNKLKLQDLEEHEGKIVIQDIKGTAVLLMQILHRGEVLQEEELEHFLKMLNVKIQDIEARLQ